MKNNTIIPKSNSVNIENVMDYEDLLHNIEKIWNKAKDNAAIAVNTELLDANWETGRYIVEFEQGGKARAEYGKGLLQRLAKDLTKLHGKGFNRSNLTYMRKLYLAFPKCGTLSHILTWSHYYELLKCDDPLEFKFYYNEAINNRWKVRELKRQIKSSLFQRMALSTDKKGVLELSKRGHQILTSTDIFHDPYVLEFTGLPLMKKYKERDLENALIDHMEQFLLELGRGFAFIGKQYQIQIGARKFKVDLVFYHCILKCYVLLDLKRNEVEHYDVGQMNLYLNYFKNEVCMHDDNPPIGIILGAKKDEILLEYAMEGISNQLFVAKYQLYLPKKEELQAQLDILLDQKSEV